MKRSAFPVALARGCSWLGLEPREAAVLFLYIATVAVAVCYYQQSMDEGREWVIVKNFALPHLVFHVLRYEGHPPLLYLLLWLPAHLHMPYAWINWLSGIIGASSVYFLLRFSPFPFYLRALLPFCFALGYQEAVVARSYALFPPLAFIAAFLYRSRPRRPLALAVTLCLLANVSFHGSLVSIGFAAAYAFSLRRENKAEHRSGHHEALKPQTLWQAGALFGASLLVVAICIVPPKYSGMAPRDALTRIFHRIQGPQEQISQPVPATRPSAGVALSKAVPTTVSAPNGSFLQRYATPLRLVFVYPISNFAVLSCVFELLVLAFLIWRHQWALILPLALLDYFLFFGFVAFRHTPLVWVTLLMVLWAAWKTEPHPGPFSLQQLVALFLALLCILQIPWTLGAIRYELHNATYPGRMMAAYLKTLPINTSIDGDKSAYAILPYMPTYRPVDRANGALADHASYATFATIDTLRRHGSDILLLNELLDSPKAVSDLSAFGYTETHTFCGGPYFPNEPIGITCFHVFAKNRTR